LKRKVYITPKSYIDLLGSYSGLLETKYQDVSGNKNKLALGSVKLQETEATVAKLKEDLTIAAPKLKQANKDANVLIKEVQFKTANA